MWVYTQEELDARLLLAGPTAFWLDHWLLLHADQTPEPWSTRPLGARTLTGLLGQADNSVNRVLNRQLGVEIKAFARSAVSMGLAVPLEGDGEIHTAPGSWSGWLCDDVYEAYFDGALGALTGSIASNDLVTCAFASRRLATELSDAGISARHVVQKSLAALKAAREKLEPEQVIRDLRGEAVRSYTIRLPLSKTRVNGDVARRGSRSDVEFSYERHDDGSRWLVGVAIQVDARWTEEALEQGLQRLSTIIDFLRTRHLVATNLYGIAEVQEADASEPMYVPLPSPLWQRGGQSRRVPTVPVNRSEGISQDRWDATRWQLSQAMGTWAEDRHAAAASTWQALETFFGGRTQVHRYVPEYALRLRTAALREWAAALTRQAFILRKQTGVCDWYYWNQQRVEFGRWHARVLHTKSPHHYGSWSTPEAPNLLFAPRVGLLVDRPSKSRDWLQRLIISDLELLYATRNAVVHSGVRLGHPRLAGHLGRTGLELILDVMNRPSDSEQAISDEQA